MSEKLGHGHDAGFIYTLGAAGSGNVWVRCADCNRLMSYNEQEFTLPEGAIHQNANGTLYWPEMFKYLTQNNNDSTNFWNER